MELPQNPARVSSPTVKEEPQLPNTSAPEPLQPQGPSPRWYDPLALLLGQWFFSGRSPKAPGTVGSLFAVPLFWAMRPLSPLAYWAITVGVSVVGVAISQRCSQLLGDKDPSSVVIDEVAGVLIAMGMVSQGPFWLLALAWVLFRVFDIKKPSLIDRVQYLPPAGLGIMADDVLAGLVAGALCFGLQFAI